MKTKDINTTAKVVGVNYRNSSIYGNPSYWVVFETPAGGTVWAYTAPNHSCGYGCRNFQGMTCEINYHYTNGGKAIITRMAKAGK